MNSGGENWLRMLKPIAMKQSCEHKNCPFSRNRSHFAPLSGIEIDRDQRGVRFGIDLAHCHRASMVKPEVA
jgi:hypothetical protein